MVHIQTKMHATCNSASRLSTQATKHSITSQTGALAPMSVLLLALMTAATTLQSTSDNAVGQDHRGIQKRSRRKSP